VDDRNQQRVLPSLHRVRIATLRFVAGLTCRTGGDVQVSVASNIAGPWPSSGTVVYTPPAPLGDVWAPELHRINGAFYIYVAMDTGGENANHRMYVLQGTSTTDPTQPFNVRALSARCGRRILI
jgi:GH43 family beta-xylosidase